MLSLARDPNQIIGNDSPAYLPSGIELSLMTDLIKTYPMVAALAHPELSTTARALPSAT